MNYPVLASVPGGTSSRVLPAIQNRGFGDGRPIDRYTPPSELPFIIGVAEAAAWLGVHHITLRRNAATGIVPCVRVGKKLCFRKDQLLASIEKGAGMAGRRARGLVQPPKGSPSAIRK